MVDTRDGSRQVDTYERLIATESACGDESCGFGQYEPRFDGLVGSYETAVEPEATVRPVVAVEHDSRTLEGRAIDAAERRWQDDATEVLTAAESAVADSSSPA